MMLTMVCGIEISITDTHKRIYLLHITKCKLIVKNMYRNLLRINTFTEYNYTIV